VQVKKPQEEEEESVNLNEIIVINEMQGKESQVQEEHGTISETGDTVINGLQVKELQEKRSSCRIKKQSVRMKDDFLWLTR
jgi:hypothetical protein